MIRGQRELTASRASQALTDRERETLRLFASGRSYAQIAEARATRPWPSETRSIAFRTSWESIRNRRS